MKQLVVKVADLPFLTPIGRGPIAGEHLFEGRSFGLDQLTLVLGESPPGQGTRLHRHGVDEMIVIHAGRGTFTVGETTIEAGPGDVVLFPAGAVHRFVNHTMDTLCHMDVFAMGSFSVDVIQD